MKQLTHITANGSLDKYIIPSEFQLFDESTPKMKEQPQQKVVQKLF